MSRGKKPESANGRKAIFLLPNLFTTANLVLGILAVFYAVKDALTLRFFLETKEMPYVWPARLLLAAIFMDFLDGRLARATGATSRFGLEYDSLADLVSFGVAPAVLIYLAVLQYVEWGLPVCVLYVVCAAIRLARFNVQAELEEKGKFLGLPSPAAAGLLVSYVLLSRWGGWYGKGIILNKVMGWYEENINFVEFLIVPSLMLLIAVLMVSTVPYPGFKHWSRERVRARTVPFLALLVFALIRAAEMTVFLMALSYVLLGVGQLMMRKGWRRLFANHST